MCRMLSSLAEGRVAVLLEGGYNLKSVSDSMMMCSNALLGDPLPTPKIEAIQPEADVTFQRVVKYLLPYWSSLDVDVHSVEKNKQA
jgi:histone deacetylase 6